MMTMEKRNKVPYMCPLSGFNLCKGESCAWWDTETMKCAVVALVDAVDVTASFTEAKPFSPYSRIDDDL